MTKTRQTLARYGGSLALVLGLHAAAVLLMLDWSVPQAVELPPEAMVVELAPLPEPAPPPPPKAVPPPPAPVEEPPLPKLAEAPKPKIAVAKPKPKPKPQPPKQPVKKPEPPKDEPPSEEVAETPPSVEPPKKSAAPAPSIASNSNALPTWQSDLLRHLAKYKKYPDDARRRNLQGVTRLSFVVDSQGRVVSSSVTAGSGSAALDRATLDMLRRAQPLPKPPAEILNGGSISVTAPFAFTLDRRR
ncbi:energy transducer TonB [Pseudomonas sp. RP23018S]|uniref:energy transducer TonB n=1 Tax=Pseudomonas sp. RP23018S TaxID=3096037 RepID=UPI002ACAF791|nr:energy transducer TonB [Pseudomonas sp. RP23018S]MDZ5603077.1 energy transducer TonB [Pseudomonas sp. RP23018S]